MNLKKVYRLYLGAANSAQAWPAQAVARHAGADGNLAGTQPALVARDALACGRRFHTLNVIDDYSRECLARIVDISLSGQRIVRERLSSPMLREGKWEIDWRLYSNWRSSKSRWRNCPRAQTCTARPRKRNSNGFRSYSAQI